MFITLSGMLGSGKSTVCGIMKERYGFEVFTTGSILRRLAEERGMSALEFNDYILKSENNVDDIIDSESKRIAAERKGDDIVFDSRMAWFFVPESFKVFMKVSDEVAAERVFSGGERKSESYSSVGEALESLRERGRIERERFLKLYKADYRDENNYDLIVDTTFLTPEEAAGRIVSAARNH